MASLNHQQLKFYVENGYLIIRRVLPFATIQKARKAILTVIGNWLETEDKNFKLNLSSHNNHRPNFIYKSDDSSIINLVSHDAIRKMIHELFSENVYPDTPSIVNWYRNENHKPTAHIDTPPSPFAIMPYHTGTLAIPIWSRSDLESGYTAVYPMSHLLMKKWLTSHADVRLEDLREDINRCDGRRHMRLPFDVKDNIPLLINPGDIFIMHPLLVHAAVSPTSRGVKWRGSIFVKFKETTEKVSVDTEIFNGHSFAIQKIANSRSITSLQNKLCLVENNVSVEVDRAVTTNLCQIKC